MRSDEPKYLRLISISAPTAFMLALWFAILQMDATFRSVALIQNYSEATRNPLKIV